MRALTEPEIRRSFVNCSKGEAGRLPVPHDLEERPWEDLDFLGWRDGGAPDRSYLVTERDGELLGVTLRFPSSQRGFLHRGICTLCFTTHPGSGVSLMTARKAGKAGRAGNSVGLYMCTDMACPLYARGRRLPKPGNRVEETLSVEEKIARTRTHLAAFLDKLHQP